MNLKESLMKNQSLREINLISIKLKLKLGNEILNGMNDLYEILLKNKKIERIPICCTVYDVIEFQKLFKYNYSYTLEVVDASYRLENIIIIKRNFHLFIFFNLVFQF
jgi:hypothetical protein